MSSTTFEKTQKRYQNTTCVHTNLVRIGIYFEQGCGSRIRVRIRIQSGQWIRIQIRNPDPGGQKGPTKVEIFFEVHVLKCWMASFEI
jgi:hypothetical protein